MCGIIAGVAKKDIVSILMTGLTRLEYRGYDSAGIAVLSKNTLHCRRAVGKVMQLTEKIAESPLAGNSGIAHTRWATHGIPNEKNAHPHISGAQIAVVHNGIIENYLELRAQLIEKGYHFQSDTDSETIAHLIHDYYQRDRDITTAVLHTLPHLKGSYALAVMAADDPDHIVVACQHSPMIIGKSAAGYFAASDSFALLPLMRQFIYLQDGDVAQLSREDCHIFDHSGKSVQRVWVESEQDDDIVGKNGYQHFMQKETFEQPSVIRHTLSGRLTAQSLNIDTFSPELQEICKQLKNIDIIACGSSYHAGLVVKYYLEAAGIRTNVEYASEYLYRDVAVSPHTLFLTISQSGETADTLAALNKAKKLPYLDYLAVCNVAESALVRLCPHHILTRAGREIGVASTKAFMAQLVVLHLITLLIRQVKGENISEECAALARLPAAVEQMLALDTKIAAAAKTLQKESNCLFLGRGAGAAIAAEGALKLKELSYIHAEAYPCGELKHGPLALVDEQMIVVAVVQAGLLGEKTLSNLQEVQARGGRLIVFADERVDLHALSDATVISLGALDDLTMALIAVVPLQLFAYHVACYKGNDVDQPRNLAKSVTVE